MWLFTIYGFYSVVRGSGGWHIRSRVKEDLAKLQEVAGVKAPVIESPSPSDFHGS